MVLIMNAQNSSKNKPTRKAVQPSRGSYSKLAYCFLGACMVGAMVLNMSHLRNVQESSHPQSALPRRNAKVVLRRESVKKTVASLKKVVVPQSPVLSDRKPSQSFTPIAPRPTDPAKNLLQAGDYIYYQDPAIPRWDAAPIVVESHKLLFFTTPKVGCTVWKQLFRRMMGAKDWKSQDAQSLLPHNPEVNGLKYLYDYPLEEADRMMTSPKWTRAVMVRDPKQRFLSAFLDKAVSNRHQHIQHRCCPDQACIADAQTLAGFLRLCERCDDEHWRAQNARLDSKFWPYMDFVGHVENSAADAQALLTRVGAWDEFGASGWGTDGTSAIFQSKGSGGAGTHATWSQWKVWQWYTPEIEQQVEDFFRADFENPLFNFTRGECLTCLSDEDKAKLAAEQKK
jgi:hypothetical protein